MIAKVTMKVFFRPQRSPRNPNTTAPNGLTAKPAAKAMSARMNAVPSSTLEKKLRLMMTASEP